MGYRRERPDPNHQQAVENLWRSYRDLVDSITDSEIAAVIERAVEEDQRHVIWCERHAPHQTRSAQQKLDASERAQAWLAELKESVRE